MEQSSPRDVCPLPLRLVSGTHSGRNAAFIAAGLERVAGRTVWMVGPLQRPSARAALESLAPRATDRGALEIDGLPLGCPCCANGAVLAAGLARWLAGRRRSGTAPDDLILQVEPDGDPAMLADRLREAPCDGVVRIEAIVAVLSASELQGLDPSAGAARPLRSLAAAEWVAVAPDQRPAEAASDAEAQALIAAARAAAPVIGADWSGALREPRWQSGWLLLRHDPFGSVADGSAWDTIATWPGQDRFDRRRIEPWLGRILTVPGVQDAAMIARTERQWLGWRHRQAEVPLGWRSDSRLAVRWTAQTADNRPGTAHSSDSDQPSVDRQAARKAVLDLADTVPRV